jgi:hypothetical protein
MQQQLQKLINEIKDLVNDPRRYFSELPLLGFKISVQILQKINFFFKQDYPLNSDLFDIIIKNDKNKITGHKHREILLKLTDIIEKLKSNRFPDYWTDVFDLI